MARGPWRRLATPAGPGSGIGDIGDHPVVQVSLHDPEAFATRAGGRLPTEAEWEKAARGGLDRATYPWGDQLHPHGEHQADIWHGAFPTHKTRADGHDTTAPIDIHAPKAFGLYNTSGNVWKWTADWFPPTWHQTASDQTRRDPRGLSKQ